MKTHPNVKILAWFNFFTDFKLYGPIAILYFADVSGSFTLGMSVFSVAMVSSAVFELPTGIVSDLVGRKKTVMLGAIGAVCYSVLYAMGGSYWMLILGAGFEGLSRAFYSGNNDALLHDSLTESNQQSEFGEHLGKLSFMFQVALAVSAVVGSVLATWGFELIMWLSVIPQGLCLALSWWLTDVQVFNKESSNIYVHLKESIKLFVHNPKIRLLSITSIGSYGIGEASYLFMAAFYQTLWPLWAIGVAKMLSNLGAAASFWVAGRAIGKYRELPILIVGKIYGRAVNIVATAVPSVISPLLMASSSLWYGVTQVAQSSLFQREFSDKHRATMGSLDSFGGSLFFGLMAVTLGGVADVLSPAKALLGFQLIALPLLWIYWRLLRHEKKV